MEGNRQVNEEYQVLREKRMLATKQLQHIICSSYRLREHFFKHFVARHERELTLDEIAHVIPTTTQSLTAALRHYPRCKVRWQTSRTTDPWAETEWRASCSNTVRMKNSSDMFKPWLVEYGGLGSVWRPGQRRGWSLSTRIWGRCRVRHSTRELMINSTINKVLVVIVPARHRNHYEH